MAWQQRTARSFAEALLALLPLGRVWPREASSTLARTIDGLAEVVGRWAARAGNFLLVEAFPPAAGVLLEDWERVLGLPDRCLIDWDPTIDERRAAIRDKLANRPGGQSKAFFIQLAARLGYGDIAITEYQPFMAGVSRCGPHIDETGEVVWRVAPHAKRACWRITVAGPRLRWFRAGHGQSQAGVHPHLTIRRARDLECLLDRLKPAHTKLFFVYQGA